MMLGDKADISGLFSALTGHGSREEQHQKEDDPSSEKPPISSFYKRQRHDLESNPRILDVPDPHVQVKRVDTTAHPLFRIFNRNKSSVTSGKEHTRVRRQGIGKIVDPQKMLPTTYQALSINVADTISSHVKPIKGNIKNISELEWHLITAEEAFRRLDCNETQGLTNDQAQRRLRENGKNILSPPPTRLLQKILVYFFGGFGGMLAIAAIVCIICYKPLGLPNPDSSNLALGILLFVVISIQGIFNAWQDWSSTRIMASITGMIPAEALVLREGQQKRVPAAELVIGDIIYVTLGNKCPADFRILECSGDLKFDRSVLTGESIPISGTTKTTDSNFMESHNIGMQGTHVVSGNCVGLVIQTGDLTVFGRIAKLSSSERSEQTTLQKEILRFVFIIGTISVSFAILVVIMWAAYLRHAHPGYLSTTQLLIIAMSVVIAVVPEGLPVSVTLSLTVIAKALGSNKVLCKSLTTVETLGAVNVLCSDKTGTLTQNKMLVHTASILDKEFSTSQAREAIINTDARESLEQLHLVAGLCNAARFDAATLQLPISQRKINGDATDAAILRFAAELSDVSPLTSYWKLVFELPFNSKIKYMSRLFKAKAQENKGTSVHSGLGMLETTFNDEDLLLLIKGAPDVLLPCCSSALLPDGTIVPLDEELQARISHLLESWGAGGQRVLLLARKIIKSGSDEIPEDTRFDDALFGNTIMKVAETGLTYIGMIGIIDPPREDIPEVVRTCRAAGIRFFMVTGDFPITAISIARQCGIITNQKIDDMTDLSLDLAVPIRLYDLEDKENICNSIVVMGKDLRGMTDSQWHQLCQYEEIVFARTTPEQKLRIVKEFQKRKNVVGMTGDGVNDAPSLKAADIGIAMGSGSDVAMEASDMVLLDSFSSMVICIEYGRLVYDNLKKVIIYLLPAGTFCELWPILFPVLFGLPQPLSSIEMIIISMLTDCIASMSLIKEKPEADLLLRPPRRPSKDRLTNLKLLFQAYFIIGVPMLVCTSAMAFRVFSQAGIPFSSLWMSFGKIMVDGVPVDHAFFQQELYRAQSTYFLTLVLMHYGTLFMIRTRRLSIVQHSPIGSKRTRNLYIFAAMLTTLSMMLLFILAPFFQNIFHTRSVLIEFWFIPLGFAAGLVLLDETRKYFVRRFPRGFLAKIAW